MIVYDNSLHIIKVAIRDIVSTNTAMSNGNAWPKTGTTMNVQLRFAIKGFVVCNSSVVNAF